jgi:hypothetical protein
MSEGMAGKERAMFIVQKQSEDYESKDRKDSFFMQRRSNEGGDWEVDMRWCSC